VTHTILISIPTVFWFLCKFTHTVLLILIHY